MRIDKTDIDKIHHIFLHLQLVNKNSIQKFDQDNPYRQRVLIGSNLDNFRADEVYCHAVKLTPWHHRIWEKRKKEIPFRAFIVYFEKE